MLCLLLEIQDKECCLLYCLNVALTDIPWGVFIIICLVLHSKSVLLSRPSHGSVKEKLCHCRVVLAVDGCVVLTLEIKSAENTVLCIPESKIMAQLGAQLLPETILPYP